MPTINPPEPGELRHVLTIENVVSEPVDEYNQVTQIWDTAGTRWAKISAERGEALQLQQASTRANLEHYSIVFRYFAGLTVNHRLRYGQFALANLTAAELALLTASQLATMTACAAADPVYYRIIGINDLENRRTWMVVDCVQVTG